MQHHQLIGEIKLFVRSNYLLDSEYALEDSQNLIASGIVDSTGILELITYLEEKYRIQFQDEELTAENFQSIERISRVVLEKMVAHRARV